MWRKFRVGSNWPDIPLLAAAVLLLADELGMVLGGIFAVPEAPQSRLSSYFSLSFSGAGSVNPIGLTLALLSVFILGIIVATLYFAKHPKPWRAPCQKIIELFIPVALWWGCSTIEAASQEELIVQAHPWVSWPIFSIFGSYSFLLLVGIFAVVRCSRQWTAESERQFEGRVSHAS